MNIIYIHILIMQDTWENITFLNDAFNIHNSYITNSGASAVYVNTVNKQFLSHFLP